MRDGEAGWDKLDQTDTPAAGPIIAAAAVAAAAAAANQSSAVVSHHHRQINQQVSQ